MTRLRLVALVLLASLVVLLGGLGWAWRAGVRRGVETAQRAQVSAGQGAGDAAALGLLEERLIDQAAEEQAEVRRALDAESPEDAAARLWNDRREP